MRFALVVVVVVGWAPATARAECQGDSSQKPCGEFCIPNERVCCDTVGHPELNCPASTHCTAELTCVNDCVGGLVGCGNICIDPNEEVCCDDVGHPELRCEISHRCTSDGQCQSIADEGCSTSGGGANPLLALGVVIGLGFFTLGGRRRQ